MIFLILISAQILNSFLALSQVATELADMLTGSGLSPILILAGILLIYLVLGCVMDRLADRLNALSPVSCQAPGEHAIPFYRNAATGGMSIIVFRPGGALMARGTTFTTADAVARSPCTPPFMTTSRSGNPLMQTAS